MSDDRLKETFRARAGDKRERLRDRDNAAPRPAPPVFVQRPAPNMAPPGTLGIRRGLPVTQARETTTGPDMPLRDAFARHGAASDSLRARLADAGFIVMTDASGSQGQEIQGFTTDQPRRLFRARLHDLPSQGGVNGGRTMKLSLHSTTGITAWYDEGWIVRPQTPRDREVTARLCRVFDGRDRTPEHAQPKRSIDRER